MDSSNNISPSEARLELGLSVTEMATLVGCTERAWLLYEEHGSWPNRAAYMLFLLARDIDEHAPEITDALIERMNKSRNLKNGVALIV